MSKQDNLTDFLTDVADAIREKKGTTEKINPQNFSEEIRGIESEGNPTAEWNDVNFYDYEGTILYSYTWDEFVAKNEMPPLPTHHEGLTCQEWNYTLEEVLEQGGRCDVGAIYHPTDGATHAIIDVQDECDVSVGVKDANNVIIQWGDGESTNVANSSSVSIVRHRYEKGGKYRIIIQGSLKFYNNGKSVILPSIALQEFYAGKDATIDAYSFKLCYALSRTTLSDSAHYPAMAYESSGIVHINFPRKTKNVSNYSVFKSCPIRSLSLPSNFSSTNVYGDATSLSRILLPRNTSYSNTDSYKILEVYAAQNHSIYTNDGGNLYADRTLMCGINGYIKAGTTAIGKHAYRRRSYLNKVTIPDSVESISEGAFQWAENLNNGVSIPKGVNNIPSYCFYYCVSLPYIAFMTHTTVPTLENVNAFQSIPASCKIVVPDTLYDEWIAATNWSSLASRIVKASEFVEPTNNE